jgi:hypothetical protein
LAKNDFQVPTEKYLSLQKRYRNLTYLFYPLLPCEPISENFQLNDVVARINLYEKDLVSQFNLNGISFINLGDIPLLECDYRDLNHPTQTGIDKTWNFLEKNNYSPPSLCPHIMPGRF